MLVGRYLKRWSRRDQAGDHATLAEWSRGGVRVARIVCRHLFWQGLRVAKQQNVVGKNGVSRRKIRKAPLHSDLVALKNSRIALDRFHQRAGFALLGSRALAEAAAA
jgi:hypothetical protein